ncbi:MAG: hypothetical protein ACP5RF_02375 [Candidatus Micrarchaeia archaeon]
MVKWRRIRKYGDGLAVEGENSCVKREFGENLRLKTDESMIAEAIQKFWAYDMLESYALSKM